MLKVYGPDEAQPFIHLYHDNVIPVLGYDRPYIESVQIMPYKITPPIKNAVFQIWTRDHSPGNLSVKESKPFSTGEDLIIILKQFYPIDVTQPITDALFIKAAPKREEEAKARRWIATAKRLKFDESDAVRLINKIIATANSDDECDVGEMKREMFLRNLTENLRRSNIMNHPAINYPEPKPRKPQE